MTILLTVVGVLAVLLIGIIAVGSMLPRDHIVRVVLEVGSPPERVWRLVSDVLHTDAWRPDVRSVRRDGDATGRLRFTEVSTQGETPFELVEQQSPSHQVVRIVDEGLPFGGTWTWALEATATGTRVTITEQGFIRNPIFRVVGRLFFKPTDTAMQYLSALSKALGDAGSPTVLEQD